MNDLRKQISICQQPLEHYFFSCSATPIKTEPTFIAPLTFKISIVNEEFLNP